MTIQTMSAPDPPGRMTSSKDQRANKWRSMQESKLTGSVLVTDLIHPFRKIQTRSFPASGINIECERSSGQFQDFIGFIVRINCKASHAAQKPL